MRVYLWHNQTARCQQDIGGSWRLYICALKPNSRSNHAQTIATHMLFQDPQASQFNYLNRKNMAGLPS